MSKILILDIETSPNLAHVWGLFKQNIGTSMIVSDTQILSFAFKWLGSDEVTYADTRNGTEKDILPILNNALDQAEIVIAHNGNRFDLPKIRGRSLMNDLAIPSPYKSIDTLLVARRELGLPRNSLEYLADRLGVAEKDTHKNFPGFKLWEQCLAGNEEAWNEMQTYNIQDVVTLEEVYLKLRPYMRNHPNMGVFNDDERPVCPKCGGHHVQKRGFSYTNVGKYQRILCNDCGGWSKGAQLLNSTAKRKSLLRNAG